MEIVEDTLPVGLDAFLERPLFCTLATTAENGAPRISPLWYLWEDESVWIIADTVAKTYPDRVHRDSRAAIAIVDFDAAGGRVHHVGMRGTAVLEPFDVDRAERLLERYLGLDRDAWDPRFRGLDPDRWAFVRFDPDTVVARDQSFASSLG
ncbi:pyridoxamine 5'-phosphate oxidase family protein [Halosolutus halophilus]|uniref:pyridoxamine 5'-phosphate oxidase family protein n=1 Tax=Halosolutus halophilus TaxID=1552990 RepID=UPI002234F2AE|nr:pyridoxamine 5'-phosphate oxidase family protein [Halosolutus halophilus]